MFLFEALLSPIVEDVFLFGGILSSLLASNLSSPPPSDFSLCLDNTENFGDLATVRGFRAVVVLDVLVVEGPEEGRLLLLLIMVPLDDGCPSF